MSRVGGGGYAENRGGFGDRTGGGMSGNARDGRDGMGNRAGRDGFSTGMYGATARRAPTQSPSYEASFGNLSKLATRAIPGAGMIPGAVMDIAGWRPGFTGFQGMTATPGSYDPTNRALSGAASYMQGLQAPGVLGAAQARQPAPSPAPAQHIQPQSQIGKYLSTPGLLAYGASVPGYRYY